MTEEEIVSTARWIIAFKLYPTSPTYRNPRNICLDILGNIELTEEMRYRYITFLIDAPAWILNHAEEPLP